MNCKEDVGQKNLKGKSFRSVAEEWLEFIRDKVARTTHDRYSDALTRYTVNRFFPELVDFTV